MLDFMALSDVKKLPDQTVVSFVMQKLLYAASAIVIGFVALYIIRFILIHYIFRKMDDKKKLTLTKLINSVMKYVMWFIVIVVFFESLGIPTQSILAVAGVGSVALGFGAQAIVNDMISGFFIIAENQYSVNDIINIDGNEGIVEMITLRTTTLRNIVDGSVYIIPNGTVNVIVNLSSEYRNAIVIYTVSYTEDIDTVLDKMSTLAASYTHPNILAKPVVQGIVDYNDNGSDVRISCEAVPKYSWEVQNDMYRYFKDGLDAEGIHIPYDQRVVHLKAVNPMEHVELVEEPVKATETPTQGQVK